MGFFSFIKKQFVDILEWTDEGQQVLAWRFPIEDQEIQYGGSLTVRDGQIALFINEGTITDVFAPGMYKLTTKTLPLLTALKNWDKLFESPFKSDVVFFNTKLQLGRRWGTAQPITIRDNDFGMVRLRAHGAYSYKIIDPTLFYREITGAVPEYTCDELEEQLNRMVNEGIASIMGRSNIPFIDMAQNQTLLAQHIHNHLQISFKRYGLELDSFMIESVSLPEELQKTLDTRISTGMVGDMGRYTAFQTANAIPLAAQNEGGMAGVGATMAAGMSIGQTMAQGLQAGLANATPPTSPVANPVPAADSPASKLMELKQLLDQGLITPTDYDTTKAAILAKLSQ